MNDPLFDTTNDDNLVLHPEDLSFDDDSIETVVVLPSKLEGASNKTANNSEFDATRSYLNDLSRSKLLTADQEKIYGARALKGDQVARKIMIESRAGAENLNKAISENLLPFKVREDIRMEQKNEKKSKKKSLTSI